MNALQKVAMGVIGIAMITTLVLPGRQTPQVVDAFRRLATGSLSVAMGGPNPG
jgi:hypothetical protein